MILIVQIDENYSANFVDKIKRFLAATFLNTAKPRFH